MIGGNDCIEAYKQNTLLKPLLHSTLAKNHYYLLKNLNNFCKVQVHTAMNQFPTQRVQNFNGSSHMTRVLYQEVTTSPTHLCRVACILTCLCLKLDPLMQICLTRSLLPNWTLYLSWMWLDETPRHDTKRHVLEGDWTTCSKYDNQFQFSRQHNPGKLYAQ